MPDAEMSESTPSQYVAQSETFITSEQARILKRLLKFYSLSQLATLANVTEALLNDANYGEVQIVFGEGRAKYIKPVPSIPFK